MNVINKLIAACLVALSTLSLVAQPTTFPVNGVRDDRDEAYAFMNATIVTEAGKKLENATMLIRAGRIEKIATGMSVPKGYVSLDCKGRWIYPSFVEMQSNYGLPAPQAIGPRPELTPQMLSAQKGAYAWNEALKPEFRAHTVFSHDDKAAKSLRDAGFGVVLSHRFDGMHRGSGTLVLLNGEKEQLSFVKEIASAHFSFKKGTSTMDYPSSLMGGIALLRQSFLDAEWYARNPNETNISLAAWNELSKAPHIFDTRDRLEALRADKIGKEFKHAFIIKGTGDEYMRIEEIKATGASFIIPLNFPKAYEVEDPNDALVVTLADMKHWELAPTNPSRLANAGVKFAFTAEGLEKKEMILAQVRKAIEMGLSPEEALRALTQTPAQLLGAEKEIGTLAEGKLANFLITSGEIFGKETAILQNWSGGKPFEMKPLTVTDIRGAFRLSAGDMGTWELMSGGATSEKAEIKLGKDSTAMVIKHTLAGNSISFSFNPDKDKKSNIWRFTGLVDGARWYGNGQRPDGSWFTWTATRVEDFKPKTEATKEAQKEEQKPALGDLLFPFNGYGNKELPTAKTYLLRGATVWTNEAEGILKNADVLIKNGKIAEVGPNLNAPEDAIVVNANGKHVTSGIIDEHSHIAISKGVNEGTQESSSEVRIGDVVNSEDVNIYRQLAGGVTAVQLLHGSANPIGGQACAIKLRWGYAPEKMKIEGADGFIKFALGENVKQSNWGEKNIIRYPQSRMGVEQVFEAYFTRAREYEKMGKDKRRDLDMETVLEILNKKRFITCHSYVQSEINMLMRVAEKHNFKINTFTHILEGYKVADRMKRHGVGASSFADWWAYKMEVKDAIPYNGFLLHKCGVTVAFNSDDAEMARRLNQEAAKAVKYGDLSEEESWKFVTLNPAKLLHLDAHMGSLKKGKDADVVLWSENPLSSYAVAEMTFVDGILFFDRKEDAKKQSFIQTERARLIQKMLSEKAKAGGTQMGKPNHKHMYHCEDTEDEMAE